MAASKPYYNTQDTLFEFNESDIWNITTTTTQSPELRKPEWTNRVTNKPSSPARVIGATAASLPVNVPDWSKILKKDYRRHNDVVDNDEFDELDDCFGQRVPPHVFLARTRTTSFSVHEGIGRTLKGRDMSRVRNAIWAKTGFQD